MMDAEGIPRIIIGMVGKCTISATFGIIFVYTAELYPTPLRGVAVGICALSARIGGMVCPLVFILSVIWTPIPLVLFTIVSILTAILSFFLPETKGLRMP
ncbi:Solute carrier family 22 member 16 [Holothuria leucospilota]|uniref:Solute carrier family 22 member 16 n=1 Tax=Holothuria leucospilota TaxID=206669 RepID=A0A9Q1BHI7_HOLLE|nr:Solute carrier family 22 member 16 [Holothuria leucospilota]